jgi:magnesium transporter
MPAGRNRVIRAFAHENGRLRPVEPPPPVFDELVWIDLLRPDDEERKTVEKAIGFELPDRADMEEIELSARLYREGDAAVMTTNLPIRADTEEPDVEPVTFILVGPRLLTLRHHEPRAFETFPLRAMRAPLGVKTGEGVLLGVLETVIERLADILEAIGLAVDRIGSTIFRRANPDAAPRDLQALLGDVGLQATLIANVRESLMALDRLIAFLDDVLEERGSPRSLRTRVATLAKDAEALNSHTSFLADRTSFLLEALLGLINIEQNATIKIFSVVAVVFLPPTLIASIYGMNFEHMPELDWMPGYPMAIGLMVLSAILPYLYFKRRGWL